MTPKVAVVPAVEDIERAIVDAGGEIVEASRADAIMWTDPADAEALRRTLDASPARWIQLPFAGIEKFRDAGVLDPARTWTCAKGIYGPSTAEHAVALVLLAARRLDLHARLGRWRKKGEFAGVRRLKGGTVLIVGTGGIGRAVAEMLAPLEPRVIAANRSGEPMPGAALTVRSERLADVVGDSDWIVLCAAMTPETHHLFDAAMIGRMKRDAWIVNVGRGGIIDTDALVEALREDRIGGAALDVTDPEPLPDDHPLWSLDNAIVTSHTANTWAMALPELAALAGRNVRRFANGEPLEGLVDVSLGY